jgi:hypothetical protein
MAKKKMIWFDWDDVKIKKNVSTILFLNNPAKV